MKDVKNARVRVVDNPIIAEQVESDADLWGPPKLFKAQYSSCWKDDRNCRFSFEIRTVDSMQGAGGDFVQAEEEMAVNPMKERSRAFIGCLYELHRRNHRLCFTAAFIDKMFRPYLLNKLSRWDGDIRAAVNLWCSDPAAAEEQYGHISKWDVSCVTNMERLFDGKEK